MIYTTNFRNSKEAKGTRIGIVRKKMMWVNGSMYDYIDLDLAPSESLLDRYKRGEITNEKYLEIFMEQIRENKKAVSTIHKMAKTEEDITLLCYCKKGEFCHRLIIGEILRQLGAEVREL